MSRNREILTYAVIIILGIVLAQHMNVVVSGSMEPIFYRGDVVIIEKTNFLGLQETNAQNLQVGDIIIYDAPWHPEGPVIHRIIEINQTADGDKYYKTKGDNNPVADPSPVYPNQVVAKVVTLGQNPLFIPKIGYITIIVRGL